MLDILKRLDAYPKTFEEFSFKTLMGAIITILSTIIICVLILLEVNTYLTPNISEELFVDTTRSHKLQINVDITVPRISCDYLSVDAMDTAGEQHLHIEHNVYKRRLDLDGNVISDKPVKEMIITTVKKSEEVSTEKSVENTTPSCGSCYGAEFNSSHGRKSVYSAGAIQPRLIPLLAELCPFGSSSRLMRLTARRLTEIASLGGLWYGLGEESSRSAGFFPVHFRADRPRQVRFVSHSNLAFLSNGGSPRGPVFLRLSALAGSRRGSTSWVTRGLGKGGRGSALVGSTSSRGWVATSRGWAGAIPGCRAVAWGGVCWWDPSPACRSACVAPRRCPPSSRVKTPLGGGFGRVTRGCYCLGAVLPRGPWWLVWLLPPRLPICPAS
ncbi:hypothetical protein DMENIID0001_115210 [Sergentomyia squamirostris]